TTDTILIVLLITCIMGECSIENALKIGLIEFVVKLAIYYFHERISICQAAVEGTSKHAEIAGAGYYRKN
ncbi:MAG: DUF2061 domain-containing protein, partial [Devosiaceae bacterium]|nr:DUF2061 domain-containing protein [Devosiaceae bacterium]